MINVDYQCKECDHIIEDVTAESGEKLPKRKNCPECEAIKSCSRIWGSSKFHLPTHFKAIEEGRGVNTMRDKMRNYKGPLGKKHYY